jgi:hypothetical protein
MASSVSTSACTLGMASLISGSSGLPFFQLSKNFPSASTGQARAFNTFIFFEAFIIDSSNWAIF